MTNVNVWKCNCTAMPHSWSLSFPRRVTLMSQMSLRPHILHTVCHVSYSCIHSDSKYSCSSMDTLSVHSCTAEESCHCTVACVNGYYSTCTVFITTHSCWQPCHLTAHVQFHRWHSNIMLHTRLQMVYMLAVMLTSSHVQWATGHGVCSD